MFYIRQSQSPTSFPDLTVSTRLFYVSASLFLSCKDVEKRKPSCPFGGYINQDQYGGSLKKTKARATIWPSNSTPGCIPGENRNSKRDMHPTVHCSTIYNMQGMEAACFLKKWFRRCTHPFPSYLISHMTTTRFKRCLELQFWDEAVGSERHSEKASDSGF